MKIYNTTDGVLLEHEGSWALHAGADWDELLNQSIASHLLGARQPHIARRSAVISCAHAGRARPAVTYLQQGRAPEESGRWRRFLPARTAERPEPFFKDAPSGVGHGGSCIRRFHGRAGTGRRWSSTVAAGSSVTPSATT
jgi:hypothetical protein